VLTGGEEKVFSTPAAVQITNISFGEEIADESSRTVVSLKFESLSVDDDDDDEEDDEEDGPGLKVASTVLCALIPGKIEQASVNLVLDEEATFKFAATGKNTVYLTGNYIEQNSFDQDPFGSDDDSGDEDGYHLQDVSSDVEMHPDDLDGIDSDASRFEEVDDEPSKGQKRPRESDGAGEDPVAKGEKKSKKLKAEGGTAVATESPSSQKKDEKKDKKKDKKDKKDKKAGAEADGEKKTGDKKTLPSGVIIQDPKVGTGPAAKKGNTVRMRYIGKLTNGKEFDKNTSGKPFTFHLGRGEVIKGWDEGIVGMQVGGERILTIPPNLGYGKRAQDGIPANSTLVFEVKLLEIK